MDWEETEKFIGFDIPKDCSEEVKTLLQILKRKGILIYKAEKKDTISLDFKTICIENNILIYEDEEYTTFLTEDASGEYLYTQQYIKELLETKGLIYK